MNIVILVKQVPDTTEMKIDKTTGTLIRAGVPSIINPDDLAAIEEALVLKEKYGAHCAVVTMGPPQAEEMLREILGRGIDKAYLLSDSRFAGADTWATSTTLAAFLKTLDVDLILAGRQAIDGDTAQVGPQTAEKLGIPQVTCVEEILSLNDHHITVQKAYETYSDLLEVDLPCLLTTLNSMNQPRGMNFVDAWKAYDKTIVRVGFDDLHLPLDQVGLKGSPTQVKKTFTRSVQSGFIKQELSPEDAAKTVSEILKAYME